MQAQRGTCDPGLVYRLSAVIAVVMMFGALPAVAARATGADATNVPICHRPPDNPDNYKTIWVGDPVAIGTHLAHGDPVGTCESACPAGLCNDQDACTIDNGTWNVVMQRCLCAHAPANCDDNNPCTADTCDPVGGCVHTSILGRPCDDGNLCTNGDVCDADGRCASGLPVNCNDGNVCTDDSCDPASGCVNVPVPGRPCHGGNICTSGDTCDAAGGCVVGPPLNCDDGNACTDDTCDPATGCLHTPVSGRACDDGNACTSGDTCSNGLCAGAPVSCDDGNACTDDACDPATGCEHTPVSGRTCDDRNACTSGDTCHNGLCAGAPVNCDDGNVCTDDTCVPATGCVNTPVSGPACDDGNACTSHDHCSAGACVGTAYNCDPPGQCQQPGTCNGDGTCSYAVAPNGSVCDDGNACTGCPVGGCQAAYDIDASLLINEWDYCDGTGTNRFNGCYGEYGFQWNDLGTSGVLRVDVQFQSGVACGAGNSHTIALNGTVVGSMTAQGECGCSPSGVVTQTINDLDARGYIVGGMNTFSIIGAETCEGLSSSGPLGAGVFARVTVTYAGNPDQCVDGQCVAGAPAPEAMRCDDASACTTNSHCSAGLCVGTAVSCDDNNPCTDDSCDAVMGCLHVNDDANTCSGTGVCQNGQCVLGDVVSPCREGQDPETGSPWVVCTADATSAWISANDSGYYHAEQICQLLGYNTVAQWGGTCGNVCGFCEPAVQTSCQNLGTEEFSAGSAPPDICGTDQYGGILCTTVQWQCVM